MRDATRKAQERAKRHGGGPYLEEGKSAAGPPPARTEPASAAVRGTERGTVVDIEVQPGSSRPGKLHYDEWRKRIRITVAARAEGGKANEGVVELLAGILGVAASAVRIVSGPTDRRKSVVVLGLGPDEVVAILARQLKARQPSMGAPGAREE